MNAIPEQSPAELCTPATQARELAVSLPKSFTSRVNQMAHRRGKRHAEMWRVTTLQALQEMANQGTPLEGLSAALANIEADVTDRSPQLPSQPNETLG